MADPSPLDDAALDALADGADRADREADWPAGSWDALRRGGALAWGVPREYGGLGLGPAEQAAGHERLAGACLTTAFILSQREAALRRLAASAAVGLRATFLPRLADGGFLTVGLSQLTTSRQHGGPALAARPVGAGYRLDGEAPWVTGADRAEALILGAVLPDGLQALFVVPGDRPGLRIGPPLALSSLCGSRTAAVCCDGVELGPEWLLAGPAERVLGPAGGGGVETSSLALGLAGAAVAWIEREAALRPNLSPAAASLRAEQGQTRRRLLALAPGAGSLDEVQALRVGATGLALRATQAALMLAKGVGFTHPHPAQRWARQALFFLVWSCPRPVADGILAALLGSPQAPSSPPSQPLRA